jgi:hypothetical protein
MIAATMSIIVSKMLQRRTDPEPLLSGS